MTEKTLVGLDSILELILLVVSLLPFFLCIVGGVDLINEYMENGYLRFPTDILIIPMIFLVNPLFIELLLRIKMTGALRNVYAYGMMILWCEYYHVIWNYIQSIF